MSQDWRDVKSGQKPGTWREEKSPSGPPPPPYVPAHSGRSTVKSIAGVLSMLITVVSAIAGFSKGCGRSDAPAYESASRPEPAQRIVSQSAIEDIMGLEQFRPADTAYTSRARRIANLHLPAIREYSDPVLTRLLTQYSNLAQARSLYMLVNAQSLELAEVAQGIEKAVAQGASQPIADPISIRRLTRLGREYAYDAQERDSGAILKEPLIQAATVDAALFNQRILKELETGNQVLKYLNECVKQSRAPELALLRKPLRAFEARIIPLNEFPGRDQLLHAQMTQLLRLIVTRAGWANARRSRGY